MNNFTDQKLKVSLITFGWPMDEDRYDLDTPDHEHLLHYMKRTYENLVE